MHLGTWGILSKCEFGCSVLEDNLFSFLGSLLIHLHLESLIWTMYIHLRNFIVFYLDDVHPFKESYRLDDVDPFKKSYRLLFVSGFLDRNGDFSFERDN